VHAEEAEVEESLGDEVAIRGGVEAVVERGREAEVVGDRRRVERQG
jgi:hypothetical protein